MKSIKNLELYHIHDENFFHSDLWQVRNCFEINNGFDSLFGNEMEGLNEEDANLSDDPIFRREIALEEIRKRHFPNIISRFHCIWLCDNECLKYWTSQLPGKIYRVSATGIIFESSDNFLFDDNFSYEQMKEKGMDYWKANLANDDDRQRKEILFQGNIKVLERIDSNEIL